jgi:hypothetical protein
MATYRKYKESLASQARKQGVSRQRMWQLLRVQEGLCSTCGKPRNLYAWICDDCAKRHRERSREQKGSREWQPGMGGRRPLDFDKR